MTAPEPAPGQAERFALGELVRTAAGEIKRCRSVTVVCQSCEAQIAAVLLAADAYAMAAAQEPKPGPEPPAMTPAVARPYPGGTIVLAVKEGLSDESVASAVEALTAATEGEGVTVVTVHGIEALRVWELQPAPEPSRTEWVVFWGGESPDDCAGWDSRDDEADAEEHREWITGGGVAQRPVMYGPWTVTVPPPPAERGLSGDWSDEELAEFRRWREQQGETGQ